METDVRVFVLDWDDTLLPTKWLRERGVHIDVLGNLIGGTDEVKLACATVAPYVSALIERAKHYGAVVILTNATRSWIELVCNYLMPSIRDLVLSLPIISAADLYSTHYTNPIHWKYMAFQREISHLGTREVFSIGDGEAERSAVKSLTSLGSILVKSLKFLDYSTPAVLIQQLESTTNSIDTLAMSTETLDLQWEHSILDASSNPQPVPMKTYVKANTVELQRPVAAQPL
jgi:hypothetical protein